MAKLYILKEGEPGLRKPCRPVTDINLRTKRLLDDMVETMRKANGVGLAAPQIGVLRRIVVIEVEEGNVLELINPEIIEARGEQTGTEGCLSVPGKQGIVTRPSYVKVKALNRKGEEVIYEGTDLLARCFCRKGTAEQGREVSLEKNIRWWRARPLQTEENDRIKRLP